MKRYEAVVATTHVDSHGERMSKEALDSMAESVSRAYIPIGIEHDPRVPPQGRIASASVREIEDGEFEAAAVLEFFDSDDPETLAQNDTRELVLRHHRTERLTISSDWTHRSEIDQDDVMAIAAIFGTKQVYEVKKAAEPISIIIIGGAFLLGGVAAGFLGQIGADAWNLVKERLVRLFARKDIRKGEQLLIFSAVVDAQNTAIEVEAILTNPSPDEIDRFISTGLTALDQLVPLYIEAEPSVRRLVFEVRNGTPSLSFAVRKDCRPLTFRTEDEDASGAAP